MAAYWFTKCAEHGDYAGIRYYMSLNLIGHTDYIGYSDRVIKIILEDADNG